ncbi:MAG TPA: type IV secretion system protein [Alphaproteobacteria bacterium]|nr:type IV secretion system protein [Alphaproteobacteria bacterium]
MSQQKSPHEDFIMTFLVVFIVGGLAWIIWYFFSEELTNFVRWVRIAEMHLAQLIYGSDKMVRVPEVPQRYPLSSWTQSFKKADVESMKGLIKVSTFITQNALQWVFIGLMGVMALIVFWKGPGTYYRRRMGLEGLMREQAKSFPTIAPFLNFDPRKLPFRAPGSPVPAQLPLFSEALTPEEWLAYNEVPMSGGKMDVGRAYHALTKQLGKRWQGARKLPIHMQGLFAACALKHVRKRGPSDELLNAMARSWTPEKGFSPDGKLVSEIRKVIKDPKIGGALEKFANQHAYETTALLRCLQRAREEGGVLAPAQFVWLRGHDRALWYPLNNLGRKSYHAEAAGAMVHYTNELIAGQRIPTPRFDEVISGFETYMKSGAQRAIPELDKKAAKTSYWKK